MNSSGIVALKKRAPPALSWIDDMNTPTVLSKAVILQSRPKISNMDLEIDNSWSTDLSSGSDDEDLEEKVAKCRFILNPVYNDVFLVRRETAYSLSEFLSKAPL